MTEKIQHQGIIPENLAGLRLDQALSKLFPQYSRTQIQEWIKSKKVLLDNTLPKTRYIVLGGEEVNIAASLKPQPQWAAQAIELDVLYEDEAILVINKPIGMVVHPAAGNFDSTLLNALLHHAPTLHELPRAGIVHRLDKNTSGLLVIAKTTEALHHLSEQIKARTVTRIYQAVVFGILMSGKTVTAPIGRHPMQRKRMAVIDNGKIAITHFRIMERYRAHTRIKVKLETGRTHQIRVHMAHIHHAILGDPVYAGRLQLPKGATPELIDMLRTFKRQALHASELGIIHPTTNEAMKWKAPLPQDMQDLIACLRNDTPSFNAEDHYDD